MYAGYANHTLCTYDAYMYIICVYLYIHIYIYTHTHISYKLCTLHYLLENIYSTLKLIYKIY